MFCFGGVFDGFLTSLDYCGLVALGLQKLDKGFKDNQLIEYLIYF